MVKAVPQDVLDKNILPHIPLGRLGEPEEIAPGPDLGTWRSPSAEVHRSPKHSKAATKPRR
jgi:hypothetical protein